MKKLSKKLIIFRFFSILTYALRAYVSKTQKKSNVSNVGIMLDLRKVEQFLSQLATWWGMSGKDVVVGPCENTSLPVTTCHMVSCDKNHATLMWF